MSLKRYRISSTLWVPKVGMLCLVVYSIFGVVNTINSGHEVIKSIAPYFVTLVFGVVAFWLLNRVATIEYDDIVRILYVRRTNGGEFEEIPLKNIDQITLPPFTQVGEGVYLIRYRDHSDGYKSILFFPKLFNQYTRMIKEDTKLENPNVYIRNWTF